MPGLYVQYVRFLGSDKGGEVVNERRFQGALYKMLPELEAFVENAIVMRRPVTESLFKEASVVNYPLKALRELLMNACMHRDYQSNMPVRLYQFDSHIEIMNAGGLYGNARPENFPLVNDYRNPTIAEAMKEMKYVNIFNRGIKSVQEMLHDNGNAEATFDVSNLTAFRVEVRANSMFEQLTAKSNGETGDKTDKTGDKVDKTTDKTGDKLDKTGDKVDKTSDKVGDKQLKRQQKILEMVTGNPHVSVSELAAAIGVSTRTVKRDLAAMSDKVKREGNTSASVWVVSLK